MKITDIEFRTVSVPYRPELVEHWPRDNRFQYVSEPEYPMTMMWFRTDQGITGIGESAALNRERTEQIKTDYIGRLLWEIDLADEPTPIQCALYDIAGQALGVPIHKLLGPKCRDRVELAYWSPPMTPEATASEAQRASRQGYRVHKLKARPGTIVQIAELVAKTCGPDFQLRVDPNTHFTDVPTAARIAQELRPTTSRSTRTRFALKTRPGTENCGQSVSLRSHGTSAHRMRCCDSFRPRALTRSTRGAMSRG